jgi:plasmid stabilization system protein ParE
MTYNLVFRERAVSEIQSAYNYYESQVEGLGKKFMAVLDKEFEMISRYPELVNPVWKSFRQKTVRRFPFVIIYKFADKQIVVYSVFHTSRKPDLKFKL